MNANNLEILHTLGLMCPDQVCTYNSMGILEQAHTIVLSPPRGHALSCRRQ